jgi:hypothetical protein
MIARETKARWERGLVYAFVLLGIGVPALTFALASKCPPQLQRWAVLSVIIGVPSALTGFPIAVNTVRRERVFTVGEIVVTCVFALLLAFLALAICASMD